MPYPLLYRNEQHPHERVMHNLTLHTPPPEVGEMMDELRGAFKDVASKVCEMLPGCHEMSQSLTAIEDACMYAIAGLARAQVLDLRPDARGFTTDAQGNRVVVTPES